MTFLAPPLVAQPRGPVSQRSRFRRSLLWRGRRRLAPGVRRRGAEVPGFWKGIEDSIAKAFSQPQANALDAETDDAKADSENEVDLGGADEWYDMAADLGPMVEEVRASPQWGDSGGGIDPSASREGWADWERVLAKEKEEKTQEQRDPEKETAFWRAAAKDVLGGGTLEASTQPNIPPNDIVHEDSSQEFVTEVSELENVQELIADTTITAEEDGQDTDEDPETVEDPSALDDNVEVVEEEEETDALPDETSATAEPLPSEDDLEEEESAEEVLVMEEDTSQDENDTSEVLQVQNADEESTTTEAVQIGQEESTDDAVEEVVEREAEEGVLEEKPASSELASQPSSGREEEEDQSEEDVFEYESVATQGTGSEDLEEAATDQVAGDVAEERQDSDEQIQAQETSSLEKANSAGVWGAARNVTNDMVNMQEKLKDDLDSFDLEGVQDTYRSAARDVLPDAVKAELAKGSGSTSVDKTKDESVAEWNPDRDWKRFDDIRREQALALEAEQRRSFAPEVPSSTSSDADIVFQDDDGNTLTRAEVEAAAREGAVFIDEDGREIPFSDLLGDLGGGQPEPRAAEPEVPFQPSPPSLPRKPISTAMYGGNWSGIDEKVEEMQSQGIPLRDPKAETDFWRSAAQEVVKGVDAEADVSRVNNFQEANSVVSSFTEPESLASGRQSSAAEGKDSWGGAPSREVGRRAERDAVVSSGDSARSSAAQSSSGKGERRTPDAETTDMWLSSASEVTRGIEFVEQVAGETPEASAVEDVSLSKEEQAVAWSEWSSATDQWEENLQQAEPRDPKKEVDMWRDSARELTGTTADAGTKSDDSDWGSGLGAGGSERAAWEAWDDVQGTRGVPTDDTKKDLWWAQGVNSSGGGGSKDRNSQSSSTEFWGDAAKEMGSTAASNEAEAGKGADVDFWRSMARDMGTPNTPDDTASTDKKTSERA